MGLKKAYKIKSVLIQKHGKLVQIRAFSGRYINSASYD
jgi:hypothetical protein